MICRACAWPWAGAGVVWPSANMLNRSERNTAETSLFIGVLPSDRYCQDERRSSPREHSRWGEKGMILKPYDAPEKALGGRRAVECGGKSRAATDEKQPAG